MVFTSKIAKEINDFVYVKPRTVQEIALLIGKNWRTANSYVDKIISEMGTLSVRTFREGTRGALKIVYWSNIERIHSTAFQEKLMGKIEAGRRKEDFSPFDIYQYVDTGKRNAFYEYRKDTKLTSGQNLIPFLESTDKQLLVFSGNLSWLNLTEKDVPLVKVAEELVRRGVSIKVVSRVDMAGMDNVQTLLAMNEIVGRELVEIRHVEQPLRGFVVDTREARFREEKATKTYRKGELAGDVAIFYEIFDEEWVEWLRKVFFNMFSTAVPAQKRISDLRSITELEK